MRLLAFLAVVPAAGFAQPVVVSPRADDVAVTVYRAPDRSVDEAMSLNWLEGFALVTETRTVSLPAGPVDIRFEGVAGNIFPQSVILSGLPGLPDEKNYDAQLLTPGALVQGALGRQVFLRRTNRATGEVTQSEAIVRAGPNDIVVQTAEGYEAYHCTGLAETLIYAGIPDGLSDKPTLSIRANLPTPIRATVQLSYLASQFDWEANYVARLAPDGKTMALFAWMTVGNLNDESFANAWLLAVAGEPNREDEVAPGVDAPSITLRCWPQDIGMPPPAPPPPMAEAAYADIVVTGSRVAEKMEMASPVSIIASQEELGDLKLYRVPERVTVAANQLKQVAFLVKDKVEVERIYSTLLDAGFYGDEEQHGLVPTIRARNLKKEGLGDPLPAGRAVVFEQHDGEWLLVGEDGVDNIPTGQKLELELGESPDVRLVRRVVGEVEDAEGQRLARIRVEIEVSNARPVPVDVEIPLRVYGQQVIRDPSDRMVERDGRKAFVTRVASGARERFSYTLWESPAR